MAFLVLKKCCFCIDLKKASTFYAFLSLILGLIILGTSGIALKLIRSAYRRLDHNTKEAHDLWNNFLFVAANIVLLLADLWATLDLISGLYFDKRDKFKRYVITSFLVFVLRVAFMAWVDMHLCSQYESYKPLIITLTVIVMSIYLYFLVVVRSYYYKSAEQGYNVDTPLNDRFD